MQRADGVFSRNIALYNHMPFSSIFFFFVFLGIIFHFCFLLVGLFICWPFKSGTSEVAN